MNKAICDIKEKSDGRVRWCWGLSLLSMLLVDKLINSKGINKDLLLTYFRDLITQ